MKIGKGIQKIRKEKGLTQGELAKKIGITQTSLSQIETGTKNPKMGTLEKISEFFDLPVAILFWFALEEEDVAKKKKASFRVFKPVIDSMIKKIY